MKTIDRAQLDRLQQKMMQQSRPAAGGDAVRVTVHLGTCGIAAGGQKVLDAVNDEIVAAGRKDIRVVIAACMGLCSSEPNVTVWRAGEDPVIYQGLTAGKMRRVFQDHILGGEIVPDYALVRMRRTL